ncbi:Methyltransferase [Entamoeba marina]
MSRPEHLAPPEVFYNETEAEKYARNKRMAFIQSEMTERALELLNIGTQKNLHILDLGCGSGFSGYTLAEHGHYWTGVDISRDMLNIAISNNASVIEGDMGSFLPFRPGTFDGCISISALQWLCQSDKSTHNPVTRLRTLFESLFGVMKRNSRCIFQLYPESPKDLELITNAATRAGFTGGVLVDYPHSAKAKKYYVVLMCGQQQMPEAKGVEIGSSEGIRVDKKKVKNDKKPRKPKNKSRDWVLLKKEKQNKKGMDVRPDSKYTGRKRRTAF